VIGVAAPHIFNGCQHRLEPQYQSRILERPMGGIGPELLPEGFEWRASPLRTQLICVEQDPVTGGANDLTGWVFQKEGELWKAQYHAERKRAAEEAASQCLDASGELAQTVLQKESSVG
jgi:hypothetical protein